MALATIPVDLFNPGQVFACLGLAEATRVLTGDARGRFHGGEPVAFHLEGAGDANPVEAVLAFLRAAEVQAVAPCTASDEDLESLKGSAMARRAEGEEYPFPAPSSAATWPAWLEHDGHRIVVDHWGDATRRDNVKFWAGMAGYPGVGLLKDALDLVRPALATAAADPFSVAVPHTSTFRLDWRGDYVPMDVGFSLNNHSGATKPVPVKYLLVEVLAAIGLGHARPQREHKLSYRYQVPLSDALLPLPLLRASLGGAPLPFPSRTFRMSLAWPGKAGQARCITDVVEES